MIHGFVVLKSCIIVIIALFCFPYFHKPAIDTLILLLNEISINFSENNKSLICHHKTNPIIIIAIKCKLFYLPVVFCFCLFSITCDSYFVAYIFITATNLAKGFNKHYSKRLLKFFFFSKTNAFTIPWERNFIQR